MGLLEGKVAIVTGAGSGIGRTTARRLSSEGALVVVVDVNGSSADDTGREIEAGGGRAIAITCDVSDESSVRAMVAATVEHFGRVDCLHNNAADTGIIPRDLDIHTMDVEVWDRAMAVNLRGPMLGCKYVLPHMLGQGSGTIVNTSSDSSLFGDVSLPAYGASKAGVNSLTRYVATLYGKSGIRCNAVSPGPIQTPSFVANVPAEQAELYTTNAATPYLGRTEDIAAAVVFLLSDESRYITGQVLCVDGGLQMHAPLFAQLQPFRLNPY